MTNPKPPAPFLDPKLFFRTNPSSQYGYYVRLDQIDGAFPGSDVSLPAILVAGAWIDVDKETFITLLGDLK